MGPAPYVTPRVHSNSIQILAQGHKFDNGTYPDALSYVPVKKK